MIAYFLSRRFGFFRFFFFIVETKNTPQYRSTIQSFFDEKGVKSAVLLRG